MSRRNRVTPFGAIEADPARGLLMGNRGCLVRTEGEIVRPWQGERWIICLLAFKGRTRAAFMQPGQYTELFFLDEATACAAGHRPCHECRRADARAFHGAWRTSHPADERLPLLDARLHAERTGVNRQQSRCADLPAGTMVQLDDRAWLVLADGLRAWTHAGYSDGRSWPDAPVTVLTPPSTVVAMRAGWQPGLHPTAVE